MLSEGDHSHLLAVARSTAYAALGGPAVPPPSRSVTAELGGVFVTLWAGTALRGCLGNFTPKSNLEEAVREVTLSSLKDPRFSSVPITLPELDALVFEISLLSPLQRTPDPTSLVPGRHGVLIRRGAASGCFLPKVAVEHGWSAEELLSHCCHLKACLPPDAWKEPDTQIFLFTAEVYSEAKKSGAGE